MNIITLNSGIKIKRRTKAGTREIYKNTKGESKSYICYYKRSKKEKVMCGKIKLQDYVKRGEVVSGARGKKSGRANTTKTIWWHS